MYKNSVAETTFKQLKRVGIVNITPHILNRGQVWFEKNEHNIKQEAKKITSWWNANYMEVEIDQVIPLSELTRILSDWSYVRVDKVRAPGEFAGRGGILDIFPPNMKNALRLEYEGNKIGSISVLGNVEIKDANEKLKNIISKEPRVYSSEFTPRDEELKLKLESLKPGTYVVHIDHGIAQFRGIERQETSDPSRQASARPDKKQEEYLILNYAQGDKLLVPTTVAEKVSPYVGFGQPKLTRLGGNIWEKTKRKIKEDLIETARELAKIYAKREMARRPKYKIDEEFEHALRYSFPYEETPDQKRALSDIKKDMLRDMPMDRVICADVGFGKTEVALRAAAYALSAGLQVAFIAPTTVLAHQHYKTFRERFTEAQIPAEIKKLTRIESKTEQKNILEQLKSGKCDIVIGTHRLLQKDVEFSKLGLLMIDEEQRFGVKQKEVFKDKRAKLDILSLSATPIPRTLHFALSGLRDMSVMHTPPEGRRPINTEVHRFNKKLIQKVIKEELKRDGQVYYLHNRIYSLPKTVDMLRELAPSARIGFMHAKLPERQLIETIDKFTEGKIDVLVSTTIMENGLDVTGANTLIVEDATKLGLAQAHQIRGRIGRGEEQAFAYFLHPARKLKDKAKERLQALEDAQYLGAGYQIAMRDLELRGAGSFLGREQSGNIAKVGFNLYCQLLNEAIEELRSSEK